MIKKTSIVVAVLVALAASAVFGYAEYRKQSILQEARSRFPGTAVQALIAYVECTSCPMGLRNEATFALGEMRAAEAREVLEKRRTHGQCKHATEICQVEIERAVAKIEGAWGLAVSVRIRH